MNQLEPTSSVYTQLGPVWMMKIEVIEISSAFCCRDTINWIDDHQHQMEYNVFVLFLPDLF